MICGIYKIENLKNNKVYIGQSIDINRRWIEHKNRYKDENNNCYNLPLYNSIRKNGIENFNFEILEECFETELNKKEEEYIVKFNSFLPSGYNISRSGFLQKRNTNYCKKCGKQITLNAEHCWICHVEELQNKEKPSPIDLAGLIKELGFEGVGKLYNITGNGIKNWCKKYNIPHTKKEVIEWYNEQAGFENPSTKIKMKHSFPVAQIDKETKEIINIFETITDAAKSIGKGTSHLTEVCNGKLKSAYGFIWQYIK